MKELSVEMKRVLVVMLNPENESAYRCRTTMRTMYALLKLNLIERENYKELVWYGWERTGMTFKLTKAGKKLAEKLKS